MRFFLVALSLALVLAMAPGAQAFSDRNTGRVVAILEDGFDGCSAVDEIYRIDCFRQVYRSAAGSLNGKPDYRDAQKALKRVEGEMKAILRAAEDKSAPRIRAAGRTLKAIRPDAVKAAAARARKVIAEAETLLLRADGKAALHYTRIASIVGSNKVIFRS